MAVLQTKLNSRAQDFKANATAMRALVDDLNAKLAKIAEGGGEAARAKHLATPGIAAKARRESIYLDQRFSDHAPVIIDYDFKL